MAKRPSGSDAAKPRRAAKPAAAPSPQPSPPGGEGRVRGRAPRPAKGAAKTKAPGDAIVKQVQPKSVAPRRTIAKHGQPKSAAAPRTRKPSIRARRLAPPPPPVLAAPFGLPPRPESLGTPAAPASAPRPAPAASPAAAAREPDGLPAFIDRGAPIPEDYKLDRLMAMARDPQWLFSYWELHGSKLPALRAQRGQEFLDSCAWVLRVYRINEGTAVDVEIEPAAGNWYLHVGAPGKYQLELALLSPAGEWVSLAVSEIIETPREGMSEVRDEEWRLSPEDEERLLHDALALTEARKRGGSGFLGASRLLSSFARVSSMMLGASASGRPVAGSWGWSFVGGSERVPGSGSGGFGWQAAPSGAQEPLLDRPQALGGGPNWNAQAGLPLVPPGRTQQPHFQVKLPRILRGVGLPAPTRSR